VICLPHTFVIQVPPLFNLKEFSWLLIHLRIYKYIYITNKTWSHKKMVYNYFIGIEWLLKHPTQQYSFPIQISFIYFAKQISTQKLFPSIFNCQILPFDFSSQFLVVVKFCCFSTCIYLNLTCLIMFKFALFCRWNITLWMKCLENLL
jgi:hypothetical protein